MQKLFELLKRLGLWRPTLWEARSWLTVANPTLALSGTCERDVFFQDYLDGIFTDSLFRISAAVSGLTPNSEYLLRIRESPSGQIHGGNLRMDARGSWSGLIYIHGFPPGSNLPPSITLTGVVGNDADRDGDLDAGEIVAADSITIVCPLRRQT